MESHVQVDVIRWFMVKNDENMLSVVGGIKLTGTIVNAISSLVKTIYSIGQGLGGAIRSIGTGKVCKI